MNLETKITIYKFTPQLFTLTHYQHLITSIKKIYLKKEQNVCIIQFIPLSLHRV